MSASAGVFWTPWAAGPDEHADGEVIVSLTCFRLHTLWDAPTVLRAGLRLRAGLYGLPGAVGVYLYARPRQRDSGSVSVWTDGASMRRWVGLPLHTQIMRHYRSRGTLRSTTWELEHFERATALTEATRRLSSGDFS